VNLAHLSGGTNLSHLAGPTPVDLDAERLRRAQHVQEARRARRRRPRARAATSGAPASDGVRYPAFGRDGPEAA
jgi:hypothetical protein